MFDPAALDEDTVFALLDASTNPDIGAPILHSALCVGYVISEAPIPGKMDPKKYTPDIKRTKAPMSVMSRLQQGESVELPDGTVLYGPPR